MYTMTCPSCGKTRQVKSKMVKPDQLCRSCAKKRDFKGSIDRLGTRTCDFCGKEFKPNSPKQRYCKRPHRRKCPICGKDYVEENVEKLKRPPTTCSMECRVEQRRRTSQERYGCDAPGNNPEAREKAKATTRARYGVDCSLQAAEIKDRIRKTNLKRYRVENPMQNPEVKAKAAATDRANHGGVRAFNTEQSYEHRRLTVKRKYGSDSDMGLKIRRKVVMTNMERYGTEHPMQNEAVKLRQQATVARHYGTHSAFKVPEIREKSKATMLRKYGAENAMQVEAFAKKAEENRTSGGRRSKLNQEFERLLDRAGIEYVPEKFVDGKWFDIYIPSKDIVIELDPTYTHSSIGHHGFKGKRPTYHLDKTRLAESHGLRCIHVFEWDPWDKIVGLVSDTRKVNARDCEVVTPKKPEIDEFMEANHLQGTCRGQSIACGLAWNGALIEVMTFGRSRYNKNYDHELLRLCTKSGVSVRGGASKLFKHALKSNKLGRVVTYCDRSKFDGSVYEALGMSKVRDTSPGKIWAYHKRHVTANLLNQRGFDQLFGTGYGKGTSNEQLMLEHHWLPIHDCGQRVYEYTGEGR